MAKRSPPSERSSKGAHSGGQRSFKDDMEGLRTPPSSLGVAGTSRGGTAASRGSADERTRSPRRAELDELKFELEAARRAHIEAMRTMAQSTASQIAKVMANQLEVLNKRCRAGSPSKRAAAASPPAGAGGCYG